MVAPGEVTVTLTLRQAHLLRSLALQARDECEKQAAIDRNWQVRMTYGEGYVAHRGAVERLETALAGHPSDPPLDEWYGLDD